MQRSKLLWGLICGSLLAFPATLAWGQVSKTTLNFVQQTIVPGWTTTGATQANWDIFGFDPYTRIMYFADRNNKGIVAIDTRTNTTIGIIPMPNGTSPNGVLVAPWLHQLVVTDGGASVFVWDLRIPQAKPDQYVIPGITAGTDALDYDPFNETVYVINGTAPYYLTGISLPFKKIVSQFALPGSPELMRFNTVDGMLYQVITDNDNKNAGEGVLVYDPTVNAQVARYVIPNCVPHGFDIDPVANTGLLGCGTNQGQVMLNLKDGSILKTFPDVTGTDLLVFNPNNRRFYTGSASVSGTTGCPPDGTTSASLPVSPVVGVFDTIGTSSGVPVARLDGVACVGRNSSKLGVDPFNNYVYVGARQFPVDATSQTTGAPGMLIFADPAAPAQALTDVTKSTLKPIGSNTAAGVITTKSTGRSIHLDANPSGVTGRSALITLSTTIGYEVVACAVNISNSTAVCGWDLLGDPMIGSMATLSVDGIPVARGPVTVAPTQAQ